MRDVFIAIHAASGLLAFASGAGLIVPPRRAGDKASLYALFAVSLAGMTAFMLGAIVLDWPILDTVTRVIFSGLAALAFYMGFRAYEARQAMRRRRPGWRRGYVEHVGFNLISLFEGFVIVLTIDLGAPAWAVTAIALGGVLAGRYAIGSLEGRTGAPA